MVIPLLSVTACGGDELLLPKDGEPARISVWDGDNQTGTVGQALEHPLVVEVTDPAGRPVSGVEVFFIPPASAVLTPGDRMTTGSDGRAAVNYTLSTTAGQQMVEAHAPVIPTSDSVATFALSANPESAEALALAGGNGQSAEPGAMLAESLAVKAVDRFGNGVGGIEVVWETSGGGEVSPTSVVTGPDGLARAARTLGNRPGSYGAVARAETLDGSKVSFTSIAVAPQLVLVTQPSPTAAAGVPLERQPEIQLQDPFGAPLNQADVSVTVQIADGAGSLGGKTTVKSNASGRVSFTDLEFRGDTGPRTLIFAAEGFTPVTSTEIVVHPGPPAPSQSGVTVPDGTAGTATTITVRLRDQFGNNIPGAAGDLSVSVAGANPASDLPVTDNGNGSYTASYVPVHTGADQVTAQFRGTVLGGGPLQSNVAPGPADPTTTSAIVTANGVLFVLVDVVVTTRDAQGNLLGHGGDQVQIIPNGGAPRPCGPAGTPGAPCLDRGDGTYVDQFVLVASGVSVEVTLNGVPLSGSPFSP